MVILESITICGFLSVGAIPQTVSLANAPLTLILGENLDIGGENSRNGTGKTTFLQAISYVIFDEPLTNIKKDNLVNSINGKGMQLSIDFRRDGIPYRIERGRKPNFLRFLVGPNREDFAEGKNSRTQAEIERVIGMTHTMFLHIVALNTFTQPFLKMRPADQREVIEELMGISQISQLADQLKLLMDENKEALRNEEAMVTACVATNARIEQAIEQTRVQAEAWDTTHRLTLTAISERVAGMSEIDIAAELVVFDKIDDWNQRYRSCHEQVATIGTRIETLESSISRLRHDLTRYQAEMVRESGETARLRQQAARLHNESKLSVDPQIERLLGEASRRRKDASRYRVANDALRVEQDIISTQLHSPDAHQCSVCGQGLSGTDHLATVIAALERKRADLTAQITRGERDAEQCETDARANERDAEVLRVNHAQQQHILIEQARLIEIEIGHVEAKVIEQRMVAKAQAENLQHDINNLQSDLDAQYQRLDALAAESAEFGSKPTSRWESRDALWHVRHERDKLSAQFDVELARPNPVFDKIDSLTATLAIIDYNKLNDLADQLKHEQFLYKLLTSKDSFIRKRIIDQNLPYLNNCLNGYLERLGLPHEVDFMPDLSVAITLLGRDLDFEQLSRGEMNRVILATSFSFRDLWERLNFPINVSFLDEYLDQGIDGAGVEAALAVLMKIAGTRAKNIFFISHRDDLKDRIDQVLIARKENQFTTFALE